MFKYTRFRDLKPNLTLPNQTIENTLPQIRSNVAMI